MSHNKNKKFRKGSRKQDGTAHAQEHASSSRRTFLQQLGMFGMGSFVLGQMPLSPLSASPLTHALNNAFDDRMLVLIQMKGGNDGLNTIVPLYDYGFYRENRPTLAIPNNDIYKLSNAHGMPKFMSSLENLWETGQMKVVHSVGYEEQNLSHFRSTDIWTSASDSNVADATGWLGRWVESEYPDFLSTPPIKPPALQIGPAGGLTFESNTLNMSVAVSDPTELYEIAKNGALYDTTNLPSNCYGDELTFMRAVANNTFSYAGVIKDAFDNGKNNFEYSSNSYLAEQLALVARLIQGGLGTRLFLVSIDGYDTHADQAANHPRLMQELAGAVSAFYKDLGESGYDRQVLTMTFSEFGRRIEENGSRGTDHGSAAPLMLFGPGLQGNGFVGTQPSLRNPDQFGNLQYHTDFRDVYSTVLEQWLCLDGMLVDGVMGKRFNRINELGLECAEVPFPPSGPEFVHHIRYHQDTGETKLHYSLPTETPLKMTLTNLGGQYVRLVTDATYQPGLGEIPIDMSGLGAGTYLYRVETLGQLFSGKVVIGF